MTDDQLDTPIYIVARADLLAVGQLVDVSDTARLMGFIPPVAVSAAVWHMIEAIPDAAPCQKVEDRLRDVLWMALLHVRRDRWVAVWHFQVILATPENTLYGVMVDPDEQLVALKLVAGRGDAGEMVLTILLPEED